MTFHSPFLLITIVLFVSFISKLAQAEGYNKNIYWVLNPAGKAGRGLVEVVGDPKTGRWTTPSQDHTKHAAITVKKTYDDQAHVVESNVIYTGDNCNEDGSLCLALYYFKSTRGDTDLESYDELIFDIKIIDAPSDALLLRVGSYPSRAELDIRDKLPKAGEDWKTITVNKQEFNQYLFEDFSFARSADPFSLTTGGTVNYVVRNIRWETKSQ